jgi:hypothetical protein
MAFAGFFTPSRLLVCAAAGQVRRCFATLMLMLLASMLSHAAGFLSFF